MLNNIYRESLSKHPYGYALYEPQSSKVVKPGVCGYINPQDGTFVPLTGAGNKFIDILDNESLQSSGLSQLDNVVLAEPDHKYWGPKTSARVHGAKVNFEANASLIPAGIPANIGALYEFESSDDFGAILMTKAPVLHNQIYGSTTYRKWCQDNSTILLDKWPEIKTNGLIIVTSTHSTLEANINAWQDKSKKVSVGFKASAVDVLEIAPSSEWYRASSDGGWIASKAGSDERRVVFFGGLYFKYRMLAPVLPQQHAMKQKLLSTLRSAPNAATFGAVDDNTLFEVDCVEIGDSEVIHTPQPQSEDEDGDDGF